MKKILILLVVLFFTVNSWASNSPEARVESLVARIKQEKSIKPTLDFVHWETAYRDLGEAEKKMFSVNSPAELKEKMSSFFSDPSLFIKQQIKLQMAAQSIPQEQLQMFDAMIDAQVLGMKSKIDAEISQLVSSTHVIHGTNITGNRAVVDVEFISTNGSKRENLNLDLIDGQWWLSLQELNKNSSFAALPN